MDILGSLTRSPVSGKLKNEKKRSIIDNSKKQPFGVTSDVAVTSISHKIKLSHGEADKENKRDLSNILSGATSGMLKSKRTVTDIPSRAKPIANKSSPKIMNASDLNLNKPANTDLTKDRANSIVEKFQRAKTQASGFISSKSGLGFSNNRIDGVSNSRDKHGGHTSKPSVNQDMMSPNLKDQFYAKYIQDPDEKSKKSGSKSVANNAELSGNESLPNIKNTELDCIHNPLLNIDAHESSRKMYNNSASKPTTQTNSRSKLLQRKVPNIVNLYEGTSISQKPHLKEYSSLAVGSKDNMTLNYLNSVRNICVNLESSNKKQQVNGEVQVSSFDPATLNEQFSSKKQGYIFDSLKKVEINDSGLKRNQSQLKIDDLHDMFKDDKEFIRSTNKKIKKNYNNNPIGNVNEIIDHDKQVKDLNDQILPGEGRRLDFEEMNLDSKSFMNGNHQYNVSILDKTKNQDDEKINGSIIEEGGKSGKNSVYEKLSSQRRPQNSVDFLAIKNNLRLKKLISPDSPKGGLVSKNGSGLFTNHSVKKIKNYNCKHVLKEVICGERGSHYLDEEERQVQFNKTMDGKFLQNDDQATKEESWARENLKKQAERLRVQTHGNLLALAAVHSAHIDNTTTKNSFNISVPITQIMQNIAYKFEKNGTCIIEIDRYFELSTTDLAYYEEVQ